MSWQNIAVDLFPSETEITPSIETNQNGVEKGSSDGAEPIHMLSPHLRFKHNDDPYQLTTSVSGRITVFTEMEQPQNEIHLATIDGLPSDQEYPNLGLDKLICTIYGKYGFSTLDQLAGDVVSLNRAHSLILKALSEYTEAPAILSGYENWDIVRENARRNALNILSGMAVPA